METSSLRIRSVIAITLMVLFYVMAIGIAVGLILIPYFEYESGIMHIKLDLFSFIFGAIILWSVIPRKNKFIEPGPELKAEEHPKLFEIIKRVSEKTEQKMPSRVYLIMDMNAWVMENSGFLGTKKERILGIGGPLLHAMSVSEVEAVIAHEFGHYYGGDTKLAPFVYKTREAIERTLGGLEGSLMQLPFLWYFKFYLRITQKISRAQEYAADKIAVLIAGKDAFISGMEKLSEKSMAYDYYWKNEVIPVLEAGKRPPIYSGYTKFLKNEKSMNDIREFVTKSEEEESKEDKIYSSHPPIKERIEAAKTFENSSKNNDNRVGSILINDIEKLEKEIFIINFGEQAEKLEEVDWNGVKAVYYLKEWQEFYEKYREVGQNSFIKDYSEVFVDKESQIYINLKEKEPTLNREEADEYARAVIKITVTNALLKNGWELKKEIGEEIHLIKGEKSINIFVEIEEKINDTKIWEEFVTDNEIGDIYCQE